MLSSFARLGDHPAPTQKNSPHRPPTATQNPKKVPNRKFIALSPDDARDSAGACYRARTQSISNLSEDGYFRPGGRIPEAVAYNPDQFALAYTSNGGVHFGLSRCSLDLLVLASSAEGFQTMGILGATVLVLLAATCILVGTAIGKRYPLSRAASTTAIAGWGWESSWA